MSKSESQYVCESCGAVRSKWSGKCDACGEWSTLTERATVTTIGSKNNTGTPLATTSLQHTKSSSKKHDRQSIGLPEVDQVLGGGFVPGSVTLIAGEPGIGKSTLLLQLAYLLSQSYSVLYVSAEESEGQVGLVLSVLVREPSDLSSLLRIPQMILRRPLRPVHIVWLLLTQSRQLPAPW